MTCLKRKEKKKKVKVARNTEAWDVGQRNTKPNKGLFLKF